ncbi:hypothetical protein TW95_gp1014 [Pandoravirus inopinatum]|uniref:Uncharacterized protein n=1 Tax=Pandoravirus inopinatum TaxID=1605721 RepID=A0A0B5IY53_9VIRU|nr:hypothetical protein TW95_gp1014 [Pandoravirus inopinatum]AJF97748.1 hypothetical protein [Pandoravirus inopinatum]
MHQRGQDTRGLVFFKTRATKRASAPYTTMHTVAHLHLDKTTAWATRPCCGYGRFSLPLESLPDVLTAPTDFLLDLEAIVFCGGTVQQRIERTRRAPLPSHYEIGMGAPVDDDDDDEKRREH